MARICQGCNKFASVEAEVEGVDCRVDNDGQGGAIVSVTADVILNSQCCGMEVARASMEEDYDLADECFTHKDDCDYRLDEIDAEGDEEANDEDDDWKQRIAFSADAEGEPGERMQDTDRHGRKIRNYRYMRKFYTCEVSGTVSCDGCDAEHSFSFTMEEQASGFEDS